jgi:hypothetical protein
VCRGDLDGVGFETSAQKGGTHALTSLELLKAHFGVAVYLLPQYSQLLDLLGFQHLAQSKTVVSRNPRKIIFFLAGYHFIS